MRRAIIVRRLLFSALCLLFALPAAATTKGLNQIVTPDVQPDGILSLSVQQQDLNSANRHEAQIELGLTKRFEIAVFQGASPPEQAASAECSLIGEGPYLLSMGFFGSTQLVLGMARVIAEQPDDTGLVQNKYQYQGILSYGCRVNPRTWVQLDCQSGAATSATAELT